MAGDKKIFFATTRRGPFIKDVCTLEGEGGSDKSGQMRTGGGGVVSQKWTSAWKKKIIATIFVKFSQIIWQYVCI